MLIDFAAQNPTRTHYIDHMAPVWQALPVENRGQFHVTAGLEDYVRLKGIDPTVYATKRDMIKSLSTDKTRLTVLAGHAEPVWLDYTLRPNAILMHGTGFVFDAKRSHPSYPGTTLYRARTRLMLATNEDIAEIERAANPRIRVEVTGCPKLDRWQGQKKGLNRNNPLIALAWHWRCGVSGDTATAWDEYKAVLPELAKRYRLLGTGHPSIIDELEPLYRSMGIECTRSLDEVFERADLMIADATSAIFEFAALDRPVVPLMSRRYRTPDYGGMLPLRTELGPVCETPDGLVEAIEQAKGDTEPYRSRRREAVAKCYTYTDGRCAERAATYLVETAEGLNSAAGGPSLEGAVNRGLRGRRRHARDNSYRQKIFGPSQTQPAQTTQHSAKDRDGWLSRFGWRIPKGEVNPPDPAVWPRVALIIPVFNSPQLLERCLDSLPITDYPGELRVWTIDNASTDPRTLSRLSDRELNIRFDQPVGFSEAVNAGMKASPSADYHILFNQDVRVIDGQWLKHLIRWMESKPECAVCGPKLLYDNGKIENAGIDMGVGDGCAERGRGFDASNPAYNDYRKVATVSGAVFCLRASVEREMGLFDERYLFGCEDLEYGMRVSAQLGIECWYVPRAVLIHSSHAVQKANKADQDRVRAMHAVSSEIYEREWSTYYNHIGKPSTVAFVLPNFHSACGGARVVGALARQLSICGVRAEVFVRHMESDPDTSYPAFSVRPLAELKRADIVVATRCDTVWDCLKVEADKRFYFVQQIEDCMSVNFGVSKKRALESYQLKEFELITIGEHLASRLKEMGRESYILDVGLYRNLYPFVDRPLGSPVKVLMYGADKHKGPDQPAIAKAIRERIPGTVVNCYHRYSKECKWADTHYRPQTTAEVAELYASHDIYVYASESDGFAMTPVEAMACGTPVVLSDFPGKDQYAKNGVNCLIAPFRDVNGIAEAVKRLAGDKKLWKRFVNSGVATADRYDWGRLGAQYARLMLGAHV